ncbi:hypothetical protein ACK3TF_004600 [Chlorella vulgaris]
MADANVMFLVQAAFSFTALIFCVGMLATDHDTSYYLPVLTSIVGYWLPPPTFRGRGPNLFMKRDPSSPGDISPESPTELPAVLGLADGEPPIVLVLAPEAGGVDDQAATRAEPDPSQHEPGNSDDLAPEPRDDELVSVVTRDA